MRNYFMDVNKTVELWDLYDEFKNKLNQDQVRGQKIPNGCYHLVAHVWIKNDKEEFLISKRSLNKRSYPLFWECPGGSVQKGETTYEASIRETMEEVGVNLENKNGKFITSFVRRDIQDIVDVYLFRCNGKSNLTLATTDEVIETIWATKEEILKLYQDNKLMPTLKYFFDLDI